MAVASALCLTLAVAANTPDPAVPAARGPSEGNPGVVFVIGGVGGIDALPVTARWALPRAEVGHEQCEFGWTHGVGHVFADLRDICHLLAKATELADAVRAVKAQDPDRPVYFLAHSGGCGVALAAAEFLPPRTLERIVLLSAAARATPQPPLWARK